MRTHARAPPHTLTRRHARAHAVTNHARARATPELAQQVGRVVRALSQAGLRVRAAVMTGGQSDADRRSKTFRTQCELLDGGVDVVVATPGRLLAHAERGSLSLAAASALVLDEIDVLAGALCFCGACDGGG
jgi:superfamily II DNA/RNA helicase